MKFKANAKILKEALALLKPASKSTMPILECVQLYVQTPEIGSTPMLVARSSSRELSVRLTLPVSVIGETGVAVVNHVALLAMLDKFGTDDVEVSTKENQEIVSDILGLIGKEGEISDKEKEIVKTAIATESKLTIKNKGATSKQGTINPLDFPLWPTEDEKSVTMIFDGALSLGRVFNATSSDASRPVLQSISIKTTKSGENLVMAATDGYRLHILHVQPKEMIGAGENYSALLAPDIIAAMPNGAQPATTTLKIGEDTIKVEIQGSEKTPWKTLEMFSSGVAGKYPDYEMIVPKTHAGTITGPTEIIARAAKVALMKGGMTEANYIITTFPQNAALPVRFSNLASDTGDEYIGEIGLDQDVSVAGEAIEIRFDGSLLVEALKGVKAEKVVLEYTSPTRPITIRGAGDNSYKAVVMPMHVLTKQPEPQPPKPVTAGKEDVETEMV